MNPFLNACGMRRPLQVEIENRISHRVEIRSLDQPFAVIGRDRDCDIVLNDKQVSRRHAYLQVVGRGVFWLDLDSHVGTFVGGQAIKSGWLGDNRIIGIGPNDIRLFEDPENASSPNEIEAPKGSPLIWKSHGSEPLKDIVIEFLNGPSESKSWPVRRVLSLIGTAKRCKFRLSDRSVEPFHCAILRMPGNAFVVDLLGGTGVIVNETPVRWAALNDGDLLQLGRYRVRVHGQQPRSNAVPGSSFHSQLTPKETGMEAGSGETITPSDQRLPIPFPSVPTPAIPVITNTEILPFRSSPGMAFPMPIDSSDPQQAFLVPLVSQFGMMQQQMFDQFQNTMNALVQMFGKMHQSQMELIQQEFSRLNDLTKEINELKAELADVSRKQANPVQPPSQPRPEPNFSQQVAPGPAATPKPRPSTEPGKLDRGLGSKPIESAPSEDSSRGDRDMIVWLHQRIANIQDERETRWQKLLKLLPGSS